MASPDINTEDFSAAVDFLSTRDFVDPEKVGILGICGFGGMALNAAAMDTRIKATVTSTEGVVYYTLDGSDPRYQSADAKVYSAAVTVASGDIFRCCAKAEGKFVSAATTDEVA